MPVTLKATQLLQNASFLKSKNWRPNFLFASHRNFKRPKNREDSSDFDDFLTEMIATALAIIFKIFESPFCERAQKCYEKLANKFKKPRAKYRETPLAV